MIKLAMKARIRGIETPSFGHVEGGTGTDAQLQLSIKGSRATVLGRRTFRALTKLSFSRRRHPWQDERSWDRIKLEMIL